MGGAEGKQYSGSPIYPLGLSPPFQYCDLIIQVYQQVDGVCCDLGYDTQVVQSISKVHQFPSISAKILQAVQLKAQLGKELSPSNQAHAPFDNVHHQENHQNTSELKPKYFD